MIRYSHLPKNKVTHPKKTATDLFVKIKDDTKAIDRKAGILLIGGTSARDLVVRQAQSLLRFDRLPSYWSHAALILDWPDTAEPKDVIGAEVCLEPGDPTLQVPERNGVTFFRLDQYLDRDPFPNLAFGTLCLKEPKKQESKKKKGKSTDEAHVKANRDDLDPEVLKGKVVQAALNPCQDRMRFPLWEWLGQWQSFVHSAGNENPILQGIAHPGAAFCEYAYQAAGIDVTPGATAPNASPEHLWNAQIRWSQAWVSGGATVRVWAVTRKDVAPTRVPMSTTLSLDQVREELE
ncbi:MAG: hypothetical protein RL885_08340 [Planctomycetota bacterium]